MTWTVREHPQVPGLVQAIRDEGGPTEQRRVRSLTSLGVATAEEGIAVLRRRLRAEAEARRVESDDEAYARAQDREVVEGMGVAEIARVWNPDRLDRITQEVRDRAPNGTVIMVGSRAFQKRAGNWIELAPV